MTIRDLSANILAMIANVISRVLNNKILSLALIIAVAVIIRIISFYGYYGSDDGTYAELSHKMAIGAYDVLKFEGAPVFPMRIGLIAPTSLAFSIVGTSEFAMLIYPFLLSLAGIILAYLIASVFTNYKTGLLAALLMALLPIDARSASLLLPDLPAAFWANLGLYLIYCASRGKQTQNRLILGLLAGLALGCSWLCKESVIFLLPFILFYLVLLYKSERMNLAIIIGLALSFIAVVLAESFAYYFHAGDLLFRLHQTERNYEVAKMWFFSEGSEFGWQPGAYLAGLAKRLFISGPKIIFFSRGLSLVNLIALGASIYLIIMKKKNYKIIIFWFLSLLIFFNFGTSSVTSYKPLALFDRYIYLMLLPAIILTAIITLELLASNGTNDRIIFIRKPIWGYLILIGFTLVSIWTISRYSSTGKASPVERSVVRLISPSDKLYTDTRTAWVLEFFWKYPKSPNVHDYAGLDKSNITDSSYVLINRERADYIHTTYDYSLPKFYNDIPVNWLLKWHNATAELYFVRARPN